MKVTIKIEQELDEAEIPEHVLSGDEKINGWAVQQALLALGNVQTGAEPEGAVKDERGRVCGTWSVDAPAGQVRERAKKQKAGTEPAPP